ncbi:MAG: helix-turn-helix domain-containing protein [Xanthomonadales bacterium]|nr:helix-turn-helix domain-containing protein [Xanthomonadales bacterium]
MKKLEQETAAPLLADYLTREQLAAELHVTVRTLARWRWQRIGPPSVLLCGRRLYRRSDVAAWIEAQREAAK